MDNMTLAVCNPTTDDREDKETYPLESSLKALAQQPGTYVCSIFDCCRERLIKQATRGGNEDHEENTFEGDEYINFISWFGCPPNQRVKAKSTIAVDFFKELRRVADSRTGRVKLPQDMTFWHPGDGGNILSIVKHTLVIAFDDWVSTEPMDEYTKAEADLEVAIADVIAAKEETEKAEERVEVLEKQKEEDDACIAHLE